MAYLVIAYPILNKKDYDWIQSYRSNNDPRAFGVVDPHVTLVFPLEGIEKETFISEVKKQIVGVKSFDFVFRVATINLNHDGKYYHEFLVPDEGYSDIVKLHDKLYSGNLKEYLRFDIDFIPHIGIGNSNQVHISKARIDKLNSGDIEIKGRIDTIDIIEFKNGKVTTMERINL